MFDLKQLGIYKGWKLDHVIPNQGYQFWTRADEDGYFSISSIRTGDYNLYAWIPGVIGDYQYNIVITINSGLISNPLPYSKCFII